MTEPTKDELLTSDPRRFDTESLSFTGLRGDPRLHLERAVLEARLAELPPPPRDRGTVELLVARGPNGERSRLHEARLTAAGGMPGDRWANDRRSPEGPNPEAQLATARADVARLIANGQPLELHGDNVYLHLDLSDENLPAGTTLRAGGAVLLVTPKPHNGCKKWVQRFGLSPMQLNLEPRYRPMHLRGIYLRVIEDGLVRAGEPIEVLERGSRPIAAR
jgi:MOSC domain-containing protein YiiM